MFGSLNAEGRTNAWYEDGHSHDEDAMVGLATQLVRVVGTRSVQSCAGCIADCYVELVGYQNADWGMAEACSKIEDVHIWVLFMVS